MSSPELTPLSVRARIALVLLAAAPALLLLTADTSWEWVPKALGRLHPVILHFPIALLLLAAVFELLHLLSRGRVVYPQRTVLFFASASAVTAATLGYLLMRADDLHGPAVERHLRDGVIVAVLSVVTFAVSLIAPRWRQADMSVPGTGTLTVTQRGQRDRAATWIARVLLLGTCGVLLVTGHEGASLTHGENYLTEYLPWRSAGKPIEAFVFPKRPVAEWDAYGQVVTPILQTRCYACHNASNFKGKLVLDRWDGLIKGGTSGPLFVAGRPDDSALVKWLLLPLAHKDHMPPRKKPQPTKEEIDLLSRWVAAGAPQHATLASLAADSSWLAEAKQLPTTLERARLAASVPATTEGLDPAAVAKLRAPLAAQIAALQNRFPGAITYVSRQSADIEVNASLVGPSFGDAEVGALAPLAAHIVWLDLTGTKITDRSASTLAIMSHLRVLRLASTAVTDVTITALQPLRELESLSLYRTAVTDAAMPALSRLPKLKHVYLEETRVTPGALKRFPAGGPSVAGGPEVIRR